MMDNKECCGTCRWHKHCYAEYICDNEQGENYGLETDCKDECEDWEGKERLEKP